MPCSGLCPNPNFGVTGTDPLKGCPLRADEGMGALGSLCVFSPREVDSLTVPVLDFGGHGLTPKMQTPWLNVILRPPLSVCFEWARGPSKQLKRSCTSVFWFRLEVEFEVHRWIRTLIEWTGCINEQMKLSSWNTKGGKDKKQGHQACWTLISSVGKYLASPIWSWFDLVETAGRHCCSPNFVKINKDAFLPFFPLPGNSCFCHWGFLADGSICLFFRLHSEALTRFIHGVAKKFIQPRWHNLKSKAILWKVAFLR